MGHCYHHALSSVKKWGGAAEDYLPLHQWFDVIWTVKPFSGHSANTSRPSTRARARARDGSGNQRPWPADKVERWPIDRLIPYAKNAARQRRSSGLHQGWHHRQGAVVPMVQTLAALHPDPQSVLGHIAIPSINRSAVPPAVRRIGLG